LFLAALAALSVAVAHAADRPSEPEGLQAALDHIAKIKEKTPADLDALQNAYLVLFENFPRHQKGKESGFDLYWLLRTHHRVSEAYATLMKIEAVYQNNETMAFPLEPAKSVGLVATALLEEASLYATEMGNPYQAIDAALRVLARYKEQNVGFAAAERSYFGRVEPIARLHLAQHRTQADQGNQAIADLLAAARDWPGETVLIDGATMPVQVAAVRLLDAALAKTPASLQKKLRTLTTFEQTVVDVSARVWLMFSRATLNLDEFRVWKNRAAFADGAAALREVVERQRGLMLFDADGEEPAGVKAMRRLRDAQAQALGNPLEAEQTADAYFNRFAKDAKDRVFAAYALLFRAELELDFRHNAPSAYRDFQWLAERYGDVPLYPRPVGSATTLKERAQRWAERAHQRM
jgi:hypothetical protein